MVVKENKQIKKTLKGLTLEELREYFLYIDEPAFRAEQVFKWMYGDLVDDFGEMNNLPKSLRQRLSKEFNIDTLSLVTSKISTSTKRCEWIGS